MHIFWTFVHLTRPPMYIYSLITVDTYIALARLSVLLRVFISTDQNPVKIISVKMKAVTTRQVKMWRATRHGIGCDGAMPSLAS
jgi:hypothetical protein